jgi:ABC-type bacteriocin/lantibiotic exporter with double-glycine peptidase domain
MRSLHQLRGRFRPYNGVKTPVVLQMSATECGIASLAMIFSYYHVNLELDVLRERCGVSRDGAKAVTLMEVAEEFAFTANAYRAELVDLQMLSRPVIAFWRFNHYVVIEGVGHEKVFINDPAYGRVSVSFTEFDAAFTGIIIDIIPTENIVSIKSKKIFLPVMQAWLSKYSREIIFVLMCMLVVIAGPLLNSVLSTAFIDYCVIGRNLNWVPGITFISIITGIIYIFLLYTQKLTQFRLSAKASIVQSSEIMLHMLRLPLLYYSLRQKPEIAAILMRTEMIANVLFQSISAVLLNVLAATISLIILIKIDAVLVVSLGLLSLVLVIPVMMVIKLNFVYEQNNINVLGKFYGLTLSCIKNIETIKTSGIETAISQKWQSALYNKVAGLDKSATVTIMLDGIYKAYHSIAMLATLCIGGMRIADGGLTVGSLMAFYALQLYFTSQLIAIVHAGKDLQGASAAHVRMNDMLTQTQDARFNAGFVAQAHASASLLAGLNLSFYYNINAAPSLVDINVQIKHLQHVAFVGGTGSGKSTLVKLLCQLYSPNSGEVCLNGLNLKNYDARTIAAHFAYVSQEVSLFTGSIYNNLTLWQDDIPLREINAAIHDACLDELIEIRGLHGKVEEGGSNFSGGERQRIEIARALLQKSSILILDEATSALDVQTEKKIICNLKNRPLTIIFVAHRLSTIQHCDQIILLERGQIVEQGTHDNLILNRAHYYDLLQNDVAA